MSKTEIKKWTVLLALLALTVLLVVKAPEPDEKIVKPTKVNSSNNNVNSAKPIVVQNQEIQLLAHRSVDEDTTNLFESPEKPVVVFKPKIIAPVIKPKQVKVVRIPYKYMGMMEKQSGTTVFLMSGTELHLAQQGDILEEEFKLAKIDMVNQTLEWTHLPTKQTKKMSIE